MVASGARGTALDGALYLLSDNAVVRVGAGAAIAQLPRLLGQYWDIAADLPRDRLLLLDTRVTPR